MFRLKLISRLLLAATHLAAAFPLILTVGGAARAVTIDWVTVGDPGNACDPQGPRCFGAVAYTYQISKYETSNAQYAEFLNAVAATDTYELYSLSMGSVYGGIRRDGDPGSYIYTAVPGREDVPVNYVSFYEALRFANWLHNGQGGGDTETGAYTLLGGNPTPSNGGTVTRNAGATIFLTSENEWYKAAYYDALSTSYFDYPTGSDVQPTCAFPGATANTANCEGVAGGLTNVGDYTGSASPNGTFDQGGNVWEWNETRISGLSRGLRGGDYHLDPYGLAASDRNSTFRAAQGMDIGFRVAMIPEPSTGLLVMTGMVGLAAWRRRRAE